MSRSWLLPGKSSLILLFLATVCVAAAPKGPSPDDQYKKLTPDSEEHPGVPKGKLEKFTWDQSKVFPGTTREVTVYVPAQYDAAKPAAIFVCQDGVLYKAPTVFDNLSEYVGAYYDVGNCTGAGFDVPGDIEALKDRMCMIHFKDGKNFLGEGQVQLEPIAAALKAIDYKSWIILETSCPTKNAAADAKKNVETIRKLGL